MIERLNKLRNIALVGHGSSGKTSLSEIMLFKTGSIKRLGRVEDGNTAMDFEPEELKRLISISSGFHQINWKKHVISLIDTPGDQNFFTDTINCMQGAEGVIVIIDAVDGIKVQTELAWDYAKESGLPCTIFINKLDRERSDFARTLKDAVSIFDPKPIIIQLPLGSENNFKGVVDLITMKAHLYGTDGKVTIGDIPADMIELANKERETLIENVAEADDNLIERYLEGETLSDDEIKSALRKGTISRTFVPVICGSAIKDIGVDLLFDLIINCMPSPIERTPKKTEYRLK